MQAAASQATSGQNAGQITKANFSPSPSLRSGQKDNEAKGASDHEVCMCACMFIYLYVNTYIYTYICICLV